MQLEGELNGAAMRRDGDENAVLRLAAGEDVTERFAGLDADAELGRTLHLCLNARQRRRRRRFLGAAAAGSAHPPRSAQPPASSTAVSSVENRSSRRPHPHTDRMGASIGYRGSADR